MGKIVSIEGEKMHLKQGRYPSTSQNYLLLEKIIMTTDLYGEYNYPYALISVALPDVDIESDEIILKSNSDYRDLVIGLEKAKVISKPLDVISINFTTVSIHKLIN